MIEQLGYACIALGVEASCSHGCRLRSATQARLRELIAANLDGLETILRYNARQDIRLFRISSQVIPFGSHAVNTLPWWEEFAERLAALGAFARAEGMRLSAHPGQFTVLSSPRPQVVAAAVADLVYHARLLSALGLGSEHKLVIHGGGVYGDKPAAVARFLASYAGLPEGVRRRLVLENDERSYAAEEVLEISWRCGIPIVFDALHDAVLPSPGYADRAALLQDVFATWRPEDGPAKVHFSSQNPLKQPGAHADWIDVADFQRFACDTGPARVDCMLEAKQKDRALLRLRAFGSAGAGVPLPADGGAFTLPPPRHYNAEHAR